MSFLSEILPVTPVNPNSLELAVDTSQFIFFCFLGCITGWGLTVIKEGSDHRTTKSVIANLLAAIAIVEAGIIDSAPEVSGAFLLGQAFGICFAASNNHIIAT